jgi:hypothetical protein
MKKGKVKKAKLFTWCYLVLVLIASYFIFKYFNSLAYHIVETHSFAIAMTLISDFFLCIFGISIIWLKVNTYKIKLNTKRFAYHYDRCITAFENMDYEKVYDTYIKRFKNDKQHKYLTEKLIFAYNIIRNNK